MHIMPLSLSTEFGERLVTLCDGRHGLRSGLQTQVLPAPKAQPGTARDSGLQPTTNHAVLEFVSSTDALDRYNEILSPGGWRLDNYRRNPVFQNAHQYGDIIFTLGKALVTEIREVAGRAALYQKIEFAVEANPMARLAYGLYKGKFLNAVSVGFIPLRWENGTAEAGYRRKYLEQELLELSAVGIPANPEALQLGLRAGAIEKADLQELLALLQQTMASPAGTHSTASVNPSPGIRSADFQSAVSQVCNLQAVQPSTQTDRVKHDQPSGPQIENLRYSRLKTCATPDFRSNMAEPNPDASAPGIRNDGAQLLRLARALRQVLKEETGGSGQ